MAGNPKTRVQRNVNLQSNLSVTVAASWEMLPGNGDVTVLTLYITTRVLDDVGNGVRGLKRANFRIFRTGWDFAPVQIGHENQHTRPFQEMDHLRPGTYTLQLMPRVTGIGQFSFALIVTAPARSAVGQALFTVVKLVA